MKSSNRQILVNVRRAQSGPPPFLHLAQRHFEKAPPVVVGDEATCIVPVDFLRLALPNESGLMDDIDEIEVHYSKKAVD